MGPKDRFSRDIEDLGEIFSADGFDLAAMALFEQENEEDTPQEEDTGDIPHLHDMDSLDFYLWMEEEVDKEAARRRARKAAEGKATQEKK